MKRKYLLAAMAACLVVGAVSARAETFNYHGSLSDQGKAASGKYDFKLTLYSAQNGGQVLAGPVTLHGVTVHDGSFATQVDFGANLPPGTKSWLGVQVSPAGSGSFASFGTRSVFTLAGTDIANSVCPGAWTLDGNAGNPNGSFLGTADNEPVYFGADSVLGGKVLYNLGTDQTDFNSFGSSSISSVYRVPLGKYSTEVGYEAKALHDGSFVFGGYHDPATGSNSFSNGIRDTATNQFIVAAYHGVGINTAKAPNGAALRDELTIGPSPGPPAGNTDLTLETSNAPAPTGQLAAGGLNIAAATTGTIYFQNLLVTDTGTLTYHPFLETRDLFGVPVEMQLNGATSTAGALMVGASTLNGNGAYLSEAGVWTNASSRTFKEGFKAINPVAVLD